MNISNCPRCDDTFRVPEQDLPGDSQAQCPWCGETFKLAEVIDRLPPVLTIVSSGPTTVDYPSAGPQPDPTVVFDEDTSVRAETKLDFGENPIDVGPTVQSTRRRQSGGGLRNLIGVVIGGLMAVPIAGGILWYFGLGPFEDSTGQGLNRAAANPVDIRPDIRPVDRQAAAGQAMPASTPVIQDDQDPSGFVLPPADPESAIDPAINASNAANVGPDEIANDNTDVIGTATADGGSSEPPAGESIIGESLDLPALADDNAADDASDSKPESKELVETVDRAKQMIDALETIDVDQTKRVQWLATAYQTIAKAASLAESKGPAIEDLSQQIKASKIRDEFDKAGVDWMNYDTRSNDGVLIFGALNGSSLTMESGAEVKLSGPVIGQDSGRVMVIGQIIDQQTVHVIDVQWLP